MVVKEISPIDFYKRYLSYQKINVIDIRSNDEYICYHLEGSINIPYHTLLKEYQSLLNKHSHYYLLCNDGKKSSYITSLLQEEGYKITCVVGGLRRWKGELVS